ncbi:hypothetical protein [Burkholderia sp. Ac-20379]|uniref:hypothetical protein n=1 Tax=Burkholderia sp. Ac-20379 TaxID=2703900 RepID=UPI00198006CC|nr:hypothetical protein [Burkholderia sp. Ac-20379]MBN3723097.1 hypothetical protein [Burkholderia sp. Ac-20379]
MKAKIDEIDACLFGGGVSLERYSIQADVISYVSNGRAFDLHFGDEALYRACLSRLVELGVRVIPEP